MNTYKAFVIFDGHETFLFSSGLDRFELFLPEVCVVRQGGGARTQRNEKTEKNGMTPKHLHCKSVLNYFTNIIGKLSYLLSTLECFFGPKYIINFIIN